MADITMCNNKECPLRMDCFRYRAIPNKYRQSYFVDVKPDDKGKCSEYWPISEQELDFSASITYNVEQVNHTPFTKQLKEDDN